MTTPESFRALHDRPGAFVIPNPWDVGSARILAAMGFEALATTSAGMAFGLGLRDLRVPRKAVLAHCRQIVAATDLPVSADLAKGFGDSPESAAETIRAAADTGLAGGSIKDHTGDPNEPIFDFGLAVERVAAAVEAARALPDDFVLTARSENFVHGRGDLDDTIRRLQAFEAAGADVLYAPRLPDLDAVRLVCAAVSRPVNVLAAPAFTVEQLAEAGASRISVGAQLARVAFAAFVRGAEEIAASGTFTFARDAIDFGKIEGFFPA